MNTDSMPGNSEWRLSKSLPLYTKPWITRYLRSCWVHQILIIVSFTWVEGLYCWSLTSCIISNLSYKSHFDCPCLSGCCYLDKQQGEYLLVFFFSFFMSFLYLVFVLTSSWSFMNFLQILRIVSFFYSFISPILFSEEPLKGRKWWTNLEGIFWWVRNGWMQNCWMNRKIWGIKGWIAPTIWQNFVKSNETYYWDTPSFFSCKFADIQVHFSAHNSVWLCNNRGYNLDKISAGQNLLLGQTVNYSWYVPKQVIHSNLMLPSIPYPRVYRNSWIWNLNASMGTLTHL